VTLKTIDAEGKWTEVVPKTIALRTSREVSGGTPAAYTAVYPYTQAGDSLYNEIHRNVDSLVIGVAVI
jgi:hypothetical protein